MRLLAFFLKKLVDGTTLPPIERVIPVVFSGPQLFRLQKPERKFGRLFVRRSNLGAEGLPWREVASEKELSTLKVPTGGNGCHV